MNTKFKVWDCKIVVPGDTVLPDGFDFPLRVAAIKAVENNGIKVISCFSGWGGSLTRIQKEIVNKKEVTK